MSMRTPLVEYSIVAIVLYMLVTMISWPLGFDNTTLPSSLLEGDIGYTIFIQWWTSEHLFPLGSLSQNTLIQYPIGTDAVRYLFNLPVLFLTLPFQWIFDPIQAYNQSMLGIMVLNGLSAYHFARKWGKTQGWLCAIAICSLPFPWHELGKGRLEQGFVAPIIFWLEGIHRFKRAGEWTFAGLSLAIVTNCYWFYGPMALLLLPIIAHKEMRKHWKQTLYLLGLCAVLCLPQVMYIWPLLEQFHRSHAFDDPMYLQTQMENSWMLNHSIPYFSSYRVGMIPILIGLCILSSANRRAAITTLCIAGIFAMGPFLGGQQPVELFGQNWQLPHALLNQLPFVRRFYWPYRWLVLIAPAVCLGLSHMKLNRVQAGILALGMIGEICLLLPVGYDLNKSTLTASTYALPTSGRYIYYTPSDFWDTLPNDDRGILPLPRTMRDHNADQQVLDVVIHQHPMANGLEDMQSNKAFRRFAEQDHGQFYENWLMMSPLCQSDWEQSKDFLIENGFGWIVFYKNHVHSEITPYNYTCLVELIGPPDYSDTTISAWEIDSQ